MQLEQLENKVYQELLVILVRLEQRGRKALLVLLGVLE